MKVPGCSGPSAIVEKGLAEAGRQVPIEKVTIGCLGYVAIFCAGAVKEIKLIDILGFIREISS